MSSRVNNKYDRFNQPMKTRTQERLIFQRYFNYYYSLAITRFEWLNLPDEILPQRIEDFLFWQGKAVFFQDDVSGLYAVAKTAQGGNIDNYGVPDMRMAYAENFQKIFNKKNSVLISDNMTDYPIADYVTMYANSMAKMRLTRDLNINAHRTPVVITSSQEGKIAGRNILEDYNNFVPYILLKDTVYSQVKDIQALDLKVPTVFDKIELEMSKENARCLTLLGIDANPTEKKEHLIASEANSNIGEMELNRYNYLNLRKRACSQINKMFGLNIDVKFRGEYDTIAMIDKQDVADHFAQNVSRETYGYNDNSKLNVSSNTSNKGDEGNE